MSNKNYKTMIFDLNVPADFDITKTYYAYDADEKVVYDVTFNHIDGVLHYTMDDMSFPFDSSMIADLYESYGECIAVNVMA